MGFCNEDIWISFSNSFSRIVFCCCLYLYHLYTKKTPTDKKIPLNKDPIITPTSLIFNDKGGEEEGDCESVGDKVGDKVDDEVDGE